MLIDHDADLEAVSELQGTRALHLAAEFGDTALVTLLLDGGASIDSRDDDDRTPLFRAAVAGHTDTASVLLDRGAMIDARESTVGRTALLEASVRGKSEVVPLLVMRGADIHAVDASGRTPFRLAASAESFANVGDGSMLVFLAAHGADIDARESDGRTALGWAEESSGAIAIYKDVADVLRGLGATR
jgi:ankyrin repeat protein